jgi:hypothetical protein
MQRTSGLEQKPPSTKKNSFLTKYKTNIEKTKKTIQPESKKPGTKHKIIKMGRQSIT